MRKKTLFINPHGLETTVVTLKDVMPQELQKQGKRSELRRELHTLSKASREGVFSVGIRVFYSDKNGESSSFIIAPHRYEKGHLFVSLPSMKSKSWTVQELDMLLDYVQVTAWRWV